MRVIYTIHLAIVERNITHFFFLSHKTPCLFFSILAPQRNPLYTANYTALFIIYIRLLTPHRRSFSVLYTSAVTLPGDYRVLYTIQ